MFHIGDKIFYPMHGAGVINAIEEKEILGEKQLYYVMNIPLKNMQVMIPMDKTSNLGLREVVNSDILENVFTVFQEDESSLIANPIQRYRAYTNKMKSGDIYEGAQVIRDLTRIGQRKTLGAGDKLMLNHARQILISELVMVKEIPQEQAADLLNKVLQVS